MTRTDRSLIAESARRNAVHLARINPHGAFAEALREIIQMAAQTLIADAQPTQAQPQQVAA